MYYLIKFSTKITTNLFNYSNQQPQSYFNLHNAPAATTHRTIALKNQPRTEKKTTQPLSHGPSRFSPCATSLGPAIYRYIYYRVVVAARAREIGHFPETPRRDWPPPRGSLSAEEEREKASRRRERRALRDAWDERIDGQLRGNDGTLCLN